MFRFSLTLIGLICTGTASLAQENGALPIDASNCAIARVLNLSLPQECLDTPLGQTRGIVIRLNGQLNDNASTTQDVVVNVAKPTPPTITKPVVADRGAAKSDNGYYIHFAFNSFNLEPDYQEHLNRLSSVLTTDGMASACLRVIGHTDSLGRDEYNKKLSQKRAVMVASYLADTGKIKPERIQIAAAGESSPLKDILSSDPRNRRVEFQTKISETGCE